MMKSVDTSNLKLLRKTSPLRMCTGVAQPEMYRCSKQSYQVVSDIFWEINNM